MKYSIEELRGMLEHGSPTERQAEIIAAVIAHNGISPAAKSIGVERKSVSSALDRCSQKR